MPFYATHTSHSESFFLMFISTKVLNDHSSATSAWTSSLKARTAKCSKSACGRVACRHDCVCARALSRSLALLLYLARSHLWVSPSLPPTLPPLPLALPRARARAVSKREGGRNGEMGRDRGKERERSARACACAPLCAWCLGAA